MTAPDDLRDLVDGDGAAEIPKHLGAHPQDWTRLVDLKLTRDLLPVVSDTAAKIHPLSTMKHLGKTPSRFVSGDLAAGIPKWTERQTTMESVAQWQHESAYGICIQTRRLRAIDIDLGDPAQAKRARDTIESILSLLGVDVLPTRWRRNSSKCLIAFYVEGDLPKRIIRCDGGLIEFLATGQQFIAFGTHTSGVRYEWRDLPDPARGEQFPTLDIATFELVWKELANAFGGDSIEVRNAGGARVRRVPAAVPDPVAQFLDAGGWVLSQMRDGRLNITCPFEAEHTSESNETATQYFLAGTGGYERGHFRCLHAHCADRSDDEYLNEVGYSVEHFEAIAVAVGNDAVPIENPQAADEAWPALARNAAGRILATIGNVVRACAHSGLLGFEVRHDTFKDEIMLRAVDAGPLAWRAFTDSDYTTMRLSLERRGFLPVGRELIRDAVLAVATEQVFDSAQVWLESLPAWDGVSRVDAFLHVIAGAEDSVYTRAVGRYLWTALAGRVLSPGCQVDMVPILVGAQGVRKTTLVREIAPAPEFFMEAALDAHDEALSRRMRGKLIAEIGELKGLRSRDLEATKTFITRTHEEWIPKYREFATTFPRRFVFIGTTNDDAFLADPTGERRWLPVRVGDCIDIDALRRDRGQLWAEGVARWREEGVAWAGAHSNADEARAEHSVEDGWRPAVATWLRTASMPGDVAPGECERGFTVHGVLVGALGFDLRNAKRADEMRVAGILKGLGYCKVRRMYEGERAVRWVHKRYEHE